MMMFCFFFFFFSSRRRHTRFDCDWSSDVCSSDLSAVRAIKMGAFDFVEKPLSLEKTVLVVRNALRQRDLEAENRVLRAKVDRQQSVTMVGESPAMAYLRDQVERAAPTNGRVLILGDNGTGKELVARTIHQSSRRKS